jgi:RNA polymerase sigma factor (sigma-70 family)
MRFSAWIRKIAARLYIKRCAYDARFVGTELEEEAASIPDTHGQMDLDEALKGLGEVERLCVSLCHGAGMSHPEIAAALSLPLGTVKSHVKRGLDKLRLRLDPQALGQRSVAHVG